MLKKIKSSFYWPMQCMGGRKRQAMKSLYGFCRAVDDIADGESTNKLEQLQRWDEWIHSVYEGNAITELTPHMHDSIKEFGMEEQYFHGILEGMRMDARGEMVKPAYEQLQEYCYYVAGCVGLHIITILGCRSQSHLALAVELGHALQLTNIIRDVQKDAHDGRIYLAREWLEETSLDAVEAQDIAQDPKTVMAAIKNAAAQAKKHFARADELAREDASSALMPAMLMRDMYWALYRKMERDNWSYSQPYQLGGMDAVVQLAKAPRYLI